MKFSKWKRTGAVIALVLTASLGVAGCGTGDSSEAVSAKGKVPSKTIGVWQSQASGDGEKQTLAAIKAAAAAVGWKVVVTDSNGDPKAMASTMQSLITQKVDAIFTVYVATGLIAPQLASAKAADIPVISVGYQGTPAKDVTAEYAPDQAAQAKLLLARMAQDLPDGGTVSPIAVAGYYGIDQEVDTLESDASSFGFTPLARQDVPLDNLFGGMTSAGVDVLNGNPDLAAFYATLDVGVQTLVPALKQTDRTVPIYGFGAIPAALSFIRQGDAVVVTSDGAKAGFIAVDAMLDYWINGTPIPATTPSDFAFQYKIVDMTNAPTGDEVFPQADFEKPFLAKWKSDYGI